MDNQLNDEIERMESEIGFFAGTFDDGSERLYDPHHTQYLESEHVFVNVRNGSRADITDPKQAKELLKAGIIRHDN